MAGGAGYRILGMAGGVGYGGPGDIKKAQDMQ